MLSISTYLTLPGLRRGEGRFLVLMLYCCTVVQNEQITATLWHKDQAGGFDDIADADNYGYASQKALVRQSSIMGSRYDG